MTPPRIVPFYEGAEGAVGLYSGELLVTVDGEPWTTVGDLVVDIGPKMTVQMRIRDDAQRCWGSEVSLVGLPADADLSAPTASALPEHVDTYATSLGMVHGGALDDVVRIVLHVSGALHSGGLPHVPVAGGGAQPRLDFELAGAAVTLVSLGAPESMDGSFTHVAEVTHPKGEPLSDELVDRVLGSLWALLSFVAGQEVGATIAVGFDETGRPTWTAWGSPRQRIGKPGARWCSTNQLAEAIPTVARGFDQLESDEALAAVVRRGIGFLHAASAGEVLDIRVPVACTGLELLAWAVLQRRELVVARDVLHDLPAAAAVRILLGHLGIPTDIPPGFTKLTARAKALGQNDGGPEILFNIRNRLVHPPARIDRIEWPTSSQMIEAWQLGTWYLELVILRLLGYDGLYWSRLRLGRGEWDVEAVPWAPSP